MFFHEAPGGGLEPLEGEELRAAQEHAWNNDPTQFAFAYFEEAFTDYPLFIQFADRLSALIWLHRNLGDAATAEMANHRELQRSGKHQVPDWAGESDLVLQEEMYLLEDMRTIGAGAVIAATAATVESLVTDMLRFEGGTQNLPKGLQPKVAALLTRWPGIPEPDEVRENVKWLADRRNSFAHSLLDEVVPSDRPRKPWVFDNDAVEEAFERSGAIAELLAVAWNQRLRTGPTTPAGQQAERRQDS